MTESVKLQDISKALELRIQRKFAALDPEDPKMRVALLRAALLVEAEAKLNIRRKGIIDTGRLLNSISHVFFKSRAGGGVRIGSFGVPYAAIHEFGGVFDIRQRRAMFSALGKRGKLNGPDSRVSKGVIIGNTFKARPYLRPALEKHVQRISRIIAGAFE